MITAMRRRAVEDDVAGRKRSPFVAMDSSKVGGMGTGYEEQGRTRAKLGNGGNAKGRSREGRKTKEAYDGLRWNIRDV